MLSIWMVRAEKMKNSSCPPGQQGEIQIPGKLAEPTSTTADHRKMIVMEVLLKVRP